METLVNVQILMRMTSVNLNQYSFYNILYVPVWVYFITDELQIYYSSMTYE